MRRREAVAVGVAVVLVAEAFVVPHFDLGIVTPLINATPGRFRTFAGVAPIFGWWNTARSSPPPAASGSSVPRISVLPAEPDGQCRPRYEPARCDDQARFPAADCSTSVSAAIRRDQI